MSENVEQHQAHIRELFCRLRDNKLVIQLRKCNFGKTEIDFLEYHITEGGYRLPKKRVGAINNFPKPETIAELRRFLGTINYYRY